MFIVTEDVKEYRKKALEYVTEEDIVLEVGCADGVTSYLLSKKAKKVVGIDKSKEAIERALKRWKKENLEFYLMDGFDIRRILRKFGKVFTVILIDISGSRDPSDVLRLAISYEKAFNPRLIIIKNRPLKKFVEKVIYNDFKIKDINELMYYLKREWEKLNIVFKEVKLVKEEYKDLWEMVLSYYNDLKYFYEKRDYVKVFELENYIWGLLDALANLKALEIPEKIKRWFKI